MIRIRELSSTYFWTATIISLLPAICFLVVDVNDWPNNWDDFQRLFNGISPEHDIISYGLDVSNVMMKLAVHDPVLTLSNRLRFQFPLLSIVTEVVLIISPILVFSRLAYLRGETLLCISMTMGFSGLMLVHTVFLPPAAYPLGFSLAFFLALFISIELINYLLYNNSPLVNLIIIVMIGIEQITFIFYASCYLQSFFITIAGLSTTLLLSKNLLTPKKLFILIFVQITRFSIFPLLTFIWRLNHNTVPTESLSSELSLKGIIYAMLKWSFGGTTLSTFWRMGSPRIQLEGNITLSKLLLLLLMILIFIICLVMWSKIALKNYQVDRIYPEVENIFFQRLNPHLAIIMIGLSICIAWCLPIISSRYYSEMQQDISQIYVAMRYSSFGLILAIASSIAYVFKSIYTRASHHNQHFSDKLHSTYVTKIFIYCFFPLWLYSGLVNINSLYEEHYFAPQGISLKIICDRENFTSTDYLFFGNLVPSEVIDSGVDGWLPSLNLNNNNLNNNVEEFIGKTFIKNSLRLCNNSKL